MLIVTFLLLETITTGMENVRTALALCFIAQRNLVLLTNNRISCINQLRSLLEDEYGIDDIIEVDLLHSQGDFYKQVTDQMVKRLQGMQPVLHQVIIWKNLEAVEMDFDRKNSIIRIFNELEQYNTLRTRDRSSDEPFQFGSYMVNKPEFFLVILVMKHGRSLPKIHPQIKERFWFSQYCPIQDGHHHSHHHHLHSKINHGEHSHSMDDVLDGRQKLTTVFANAQIQEYVCSLLVFTRSHRLCSLAPLSTRPTLRALEGIMLLAKALVVLRSAPGDVLFVTPEFIKVAFRKIGYWLVDWETNTLFNETSMEYDYRKKLELTILTGDWYGSEWETAKDYMEKFSSTKDESTTTGYTNMVVEDVLQSVRPPI